MAVSVRLLGTPSIRWGGVDHEPPATRASALAYYLAFQGRWVARDELLALFWPDVDESRARTNLRQVLTTLRRMPFCGGVEVEVPRVRWLAETDLAVLRASLARAPSSDTPDSEPPGPPGALLDGFVVRSSESFDAWLEEARTRLLDEFREKWLAVAEDAMRRDRVDRALAWWSSWLRVEPLDEPVVGSFLRHCRAGGRAAEGVRTFEAFRTRLARELDLQPTDELVFLASELRQASGSPALSEPSSGVGAVAATMAGPEESDSPGVSGLDVALPALVGRTEELKRLLDVLRAPGAVVVLVAPGGMGKTRLAQEVVERFRRDVGEKSPSPDDGGSEREVTESSVTAFVALVEVTTVEEAAAAVASVVAPGAFRALPPRERARATVVGRRGLVVLDNVEQIEGIEELVDDLRRAAPEVAWLLTSRVAPRVSRAVTVFLGGLPTPEEGDLAPMLADVEVSPAAQLFLERARALGRPVSDSEAGAVAELARAVGGMPLALELAAGWSQVLALPVVHGKLAATSGDVLPGSSHLPERHGSLARVFDRTWDQLPGPLQGALLRLGVVVGGCTADAAADVAGVDLGTVAELRRHALIEVTQDGRLTQHPVVRQYVVQRMEEVKQALGPVRYAHAEYYFALVERMEQHGQGSGGAAEIAALVAEHGNIEVAWRWAIDHHWWDALMKPGAMTGLSYGSVGKVPTFLEMTNSAKSRVPEGSLAWCWFETNQTFFDAMASRITAQEAYEHTRQLVARVRKFDRPLEVGWIMHLSSQVAARIGNRNEARALTQETFRLWREVDATHLLPMPARMAVLLTIDLDERQRATQVLKDVVERSGGPDHVALFASLRAWDLATTWGRYQEALRLVDHAVQAFEGLGFEQDHAKVLRIAADICLLAGELEHARVHARQALELVRPYGVHAHVHANVLRVQIAEATWLAGDTETAKHVMTEEVERDGGTHAHRLRVRIALAEGDVVVARGELEALRDHVADSLVTRDDHYADVRLSWLEAAVAAAEGNRERAIASLVAGLDRCIARTFVPLSLGGLAIAARYLGPAERQRVLRAVAAHPATPYGVRIDPAVAAHARVTSIADTARVVRAYPAMQQRVLARLRSIKRRSDPGTTTR